MAYRPYTSSYIPSTVLDQDMINYGRSPSSAKSRTFFDRVFPEEADVEELMTPSYTPGPVRYIPRVQEDTGEGEGYNPDPSTLPQGESEFLNSLFGSNYDGNRATSAEDIIEQGINKYSGTADTIGDISSFLSLTPLAPVGFAGSALSGKSELDGINEYLASINAEPLSKSQIAKAAINPVMGLEDYGKQNAMDALGFNNNRTDFSKSPEQARAEQDYLSNMDRNMTVAELSDQLNNPRSFDAPNPSMSVNAPAPTFLSDYYTAPQQNMTSAYDRPNSGTFSGGSSTQDLIGGKNTDTLDQTIDKNLGPASATLSNIQSFDKKGDRKGYNQALDAATAQWGSSANLGNAVKDEQSSSRSPVSSLDATRTNNAISYTPVGPGTNNSLSPGWQRGMNTYWDNQNAEALDKRSSYGQDEYSKSLMSDLSAPVNVDNFSAIAKDPNSAAYSDFGSVTKDPNSAAYSDFGLSGLLGGLTDQNIAGDISRSRNTDMGTYGDFTKDNNNKGVLNSLVSNNRTTQPEEKSLMSSLLGGSLFGGGGYELDASGANKSMNDTLNPPAPGQPRLGYGNSPFDPGPSFDSFGDWSDAVFGGGASAGTQDNTDEKGQATGQDDSYGDEGSCFITTAACKVMGLPDNCDQLETLRGFRDEYMMNNLEGRKLVKQYYKEAPEVVASIKDLDIYRKWFVIYIEPAVQLIKDKKLQQAQQLYTKLFKEAKNVST